MALSEERIISSAEADSMILQSIEAIEGRSDRFGKLTKIWIFAILHVLSINHKFNNIWFVHDTGWKPEYTKK